MNLTYKKSAAGVLALSTRDPRLTQQLRSTLIMIDGQRSQADLAKFAAAFGDVDVLCRKLADWGLIESLTDGSVPIKDAAQVPVTQARRSSDVPDNAEVSQGAGKALTAAELPGAIRASVRILTNALGPHAEGVSLKLERSKTVDEFMTHVKSGVRLLQDFRKTDALAQLEALVRGD